MRENSSTVTETTPNPHNQSVMRERPTSPVPSWNPIRGPFTRWPNATDLFIALLSFFLNLSMWRNDEGNDVLALLTLSDVGAYLCLFVGNFALLWRRSHPWQVHCIILGLSILLTAAGPVDGIVALAFSLYSLGRFEANNRASIAAAAAALVFIIIDSSVMSRPSAGSTIAAMMVLGLWYIGRRLRFREEYLRLLEERADYLERARHSEAERAVEAERNRIAREMHDIVAHQVSLMTIQAAAARTVGVSDPVTAGEAMASVETAGRQALLEMRQLLGLMRPVNSETTLAPQPGIAGLAKLVQQVKGVGLDVELAAEGDLSDLSAGLELAIYRIVQEALTNVIKHAGEGVHVSIIVQGQATDIRIIITDDGVGEHPLKSGGHGIVGMRERVQLLGGTLKAGPREHSGFEICAVIPRNRRGD